MCSKSKLESARWNLHPSTIARIISTGPVDVLHCVACMKMKMEVMKLYW